MKTLSADGRLQVHEEARIKPDAAAVNLRGHASARASLIGACHG
ncbi:MAG: hypothetical protein AWT59_2879 [Candidatus Gallionella acididurans]|uniref:Uncharacterized protein n=1 Tax=Candidatus Gallionella acididurans TaxID=1796491 RepID=A0A139BPU7_9PROT|nr:MAG: hypothetical protein AWT59_2879 [Candidatus Gallionella acididurans]